MKLNVLNEYRKQRQEGYRANHALSNARILNEWQRLESLGLVKCEFEPEYDNYFDVFGFGNCGCESSAENECRHDKAIIEQINNNGLYAAVSYWRTSNHLDYELADSIGMLIGMDALEYDAHIKRAAVDQYTEFANCGTMATVTSFRNGFNISNKKARHSIAK